MSSRIPPMPTNNESAEEVLGLFNSKAHNFSFRHVFYKAVSILYGPSFIINRDASNRMLFKCISCNKEMNHTRSLADHVKSGGHIKNVDSQNQDMLGYVAVPVLKKKNIKFEDNTLQKMLQNSLTPIVGLQQVEAFINGEKQYFKCNLCGAHSNKDSMYKHLIGNVHTDKYINSKIVLKGTHISSAERSFLRTVLCDRENYSASDIVTYHGSRYYPSLWEMNDYRKQGFCSDGPSSSQGSSRHGQFNWTTKDSNSPKVPLFVIPKQTSEAQTEITYDSYCDLLMKLNFIYQSHKSNMLRLETPDDLRFVLIVMTFALHWLYFVSVENGNHQKNIIEGCLGHIMKKLVPTFKDRYPNIELPLD